MTAYVMFGNTDEYDLDYVQSIIMELYPIAIPKLEYISTEVISLVNQHGFDILPVNGDAYEGNQWIRLSADMCVYDILNDLCVSGNISNTEYDALYLDLLTVEEIMASKYASAVQSILESAIN